MSEAKLWSLNMCAYMCTHTHVHHHTHRVYMCECSHGVLCVYGLETAHKPLAQTQDFLLTVMRIYWDILECFRMVTGAQHF